VVHLVRNSLRYASKADWGKISAQLKTIYHAPTVAAAEQRYAEFAAAPRGKYPAMVGMWERSWPEFTPFLEFPLEIRRLVYTTNGSSPSTPGSVRPPADAGISPMSRRRSKCST